MTDEEKWEIERIKEAITKMNQQAPKIIIRFMMRETAEFLYHMRPSRYKVLNWN